MRQIAALCLLAVLGDVMPARAHHRQTPPVVALTTSGDTMLPRVGSFIGVIALAVTSGGQRVIDRYKFPYPAPPTVVAATGNNANPSVSSNGSVIAWDSDGDLLGNHDPGRQIYMTAGSVILQVTRDPTGTSVNPALSGSGSRLVFESEGNLDGGSVPGVRRIFMRAPGGGISRLSRGDGVSRNATLSRDGVVIAFESSSDPVTGADTGIAQIWVTSIWTGGAAPFTRGQAPSEHPVISSDGRLVAFDTRADLATDGHDTGTSQVYVYDTRAGDFARITADPGGCAGPSLHKFRHDWRIAFHCGSQIFFYMLQSDQRFAVQLAPGDATGVLAEAGFEFLVVSTTANLIGTGTTPGHQVYLVNLFKQPPAPASGTALWFPQRPPGD